MIRRMPPQYSVLTELRGVRHLALMIVAPPLALAAYGIQHLTRHSWPAVSVAFGLAGLVAVIAGRWLMPRLTVLQVVRELSQSGFASVTRVSGSAGYPIGQATFVAVDTSDDDQPVTIEASWCYQHLLMNICERGVEDC